MEGGGRRELRSVSARLSVREKEQHNMDPELYKATTEGNKARLCQLIERQPNLLLPTSLPKQHTVLNLVASSATVPLLELICGKCPQLIKKKSFKDDNALHIAARTGKVDRVTYFMKWAEETAPEEIGEQFDVYVLLRERNKEGNTPLYEAVRAKHIEVTKVLLNKDPQSAFIANERGESPFYLASGQRSSEWTVVVAKILLSLSEETPESIFEGPFGRTPLHSAVATGIEASVRLLVKQRKELNNKGDKNGRTPLHYAAFFGDFRHAKILLEGDTSCAFQNDDRGLYPIHLAVMKGHIDMIRVLIEHCPTSMLLVNEKGQNALHVAAMWGKEKLVTHMLKSIPKILINQKDEEGNTPLHLATINLHPRTVGVLTNDKSVDLNIMNGEDLTALDIAKKYTDESISIPKLLTRVALKIAGASFGRSHVVVADDEPRKDPEKQPFIERFNNLVLVATIIATITFAAGFTFPGGYDNSNGPDNGVATMLKKQAFHVFVVCNIVAMYFSILVIVNHIWAQLGDVRLLILALNYSMLLLIVSLIMMALSFAAGMYLVVTKLGWITIVVWVMLSFFFFHILVLSAILLVPFLSKYQFLQFISKFIFKFLISIYNFFDMWTNK